MKGGCCQLQSTAMVMSRLSVHFTTLFLGKLRSTIRKERVIIVLHLFISVKLSGPTGRNNGNGTVLFYHKSNWWLVCDEGFDDITAKIVCRELGFVDGYSICCSAYGKVYEDMLANYTLRCSGNEDSIQDCLREERCNSSYYASAVCFSSHQEKGEGNFCYLS